MLILLAALALQVQVDVSKVQTPAGDTTKSISVSVGSKGKKNEPRRKPVTERDLATAFKSPAARTLLLDARAARLRQDSAMIAYDAKVYERISAGLGIGQRGRSRILFRHEDAARVRWQRGHGAVVDVTGARTASPLSGVDPDDPDINGQGDMVLSPVPYYPGVDAVIWFDSDKLQREVNDREIVHPLAEGAEAYYTYEAGDSVRFKLPDGKMIRLRELRVRPREPKWNVAVGSLWVDQSTGQVVRAAYRLSVPMDIWEVAKADDPHAKDDVPKWLDPVLTPMTARVSAIGVEYGLHQGRFWLPRLRVLEGDAQASFMRFPFQFTQSFSYNSVNLRDSLPEIPVSARERLGVDTMPPERRKAVLDSLRVAREKTREARRDSVKQGLLPRVRTNSSCDSTGYRTTTEQRGGEVRMLVRIPCDTAMLARSPDLPPSIYDRGDELADLGEVRSMIDQSLGLGAQPGWHPMPPVVHWGVDLMRYNRVEGFSFGASVKQQLGSGYSALAIGRIGTADHQPNASLMLSRSNLSRTVHLRAYSELVAANDWGNPLSFGSSLSAFLFGGDDGFYYRTAGAELGGTREGTLGGMRLDWRLFAERDRGATQKTDFSLGGDFRPNIVATPGTFAGAALRLVASHGEDPLGLRVASDLRLEGAGGDTMSYGRAALDLTFSHGLGRAAGSLTLSGGSTLGDVPVQRLWYLGGTHTVRGQEPGTAVGNAYWFTRAELATSVRAVKPVIFGDLGWAGDRTKLSEMGRPLSGVGAGFSVLDGLLRFDVARGLYPGKGWRVRLYTDGRF